MLKGAGNDLFRIESHIATHVFCETQFILRTPTFQSSAEKGLS